MQIGLVLPQGYFNEFEGWEPGRAWARIVELAQTAERARLRIDLDRRARPVEVAGRVDRLRLLGAVVRPGAARAAGRHRADRPELDVPQPGDHRQGRRDPRRDQWRPPDARPGRRVQGQRGRRVRPRLPEPQGPDGVAVRALRDHLAGDPAGRAGLLVRGDLRPGRRPDQQPAGRPRARGSSC